MSPGTIGSFLTASDLSVNSVIIERWTIPTPVATDSIYHEAVTMSQFRQVSDLENLSENWDGFGAEAPAVTAIGRAADALKFANSVPARLVPSAEGGVAVYMNVEDRVGQVEFCNDGEVIGLTYSQSAEPTAWEISLDGLSDAFGQIRGFLAGRGVE